MTQWLERFKRTLSSYWIDAILLFLATGPPLLSAWLSYHFHEAHWFQRSGSLTVLFAALLEFRQAAVDKGVRDAAWAAAKRRSWLGLAIVGQLPSPRKIIAGLALVLVVLGTIIWGYGDLLFSIASAP